MRCWNPGTTSFVLFFSKRQGRVWTYFTVPSGDSFQFSGKTVANCHWIQCRGPKPFLISCYSNSCLPTVPKTPSSGVRRWTSSRMMALTNTKFHTCCVVKLKWIFCKLGYKPHLTLSSTSGVHWVPLGAEFSELWLPVVISFRMLTLSSYLQTRTWVALTGI